MINHLWSGNEYLLEEVIQLLGLLLEWYGPLEEAEDEHFLFRCAHSDVGTKGDSVRLLVQ